MIIPIQLAQMDMPNVFWLFFLSIFPLHLCSAVTDSGMRCLVDAGPVAAMVQGLSLTGLLCATPFVFHKTGWPSFVRFGFLPVGYCITTLITNIVLALGGSAETPYMSPMARIMFAPLLSGMCGLVISAFAGRLPMSGYLAIGLLLLPVLSGLLVVCEFGDALNRQMVAGSLFGFSVPICLACSIQARRRAPNGKVALAGLAGAALFGSLFLILMPQIAFHFVREMVQVGGGR
jgi:hypothetical protein